MNKPSILASSAALLLSIFGSAAGQDSPQPAPESPRIPGFDEVKPAPKKIPAGGPPGAGNVNGAPAGVPGGPPAFDTRPIGAEPKARTGKDIISGAKLKVLQKHYEETLSEAIQLEKAALSAAPEERAKMETRARALRDLLAKLEADLATVTPQTTAAGKPPRMVAVPGLPEPIPESEIEIPGVNPQGAGRGRAITGTGVAGLPGEGSPGGYLVPSARADLERIKALEKSGQAAKLDVIKAETRLKWAEASAIGDRVGAARATRDGAKRRLDLMRALRAPGTTTTDTASPEAVAEAERELRAAEADLRIQEEAAGSGSLGVPAAGGAPTPAKSN